MTAAVLVLLLAGAAPAAEPCRAAASALAGSRQLVLVASEGWDSLAATMSFHERNSDSAPWQEAHAPVPAVVGREGLAWGLEYVWLGGRPAKREGDGRSAAGVFRLGRKFGFAPSKESGYLRLEDSTECVDDPGSRHYNAVVDSAKVSKDWASSEKMREAPVYERGVVIDYVSSAEKRAGSCLFVHVWRGPEQGTAGCAAAEEPALAFLHSWLRRDRKPVIAVLPAYDLPRWKSCLP